MRLSKGTAVLSAAGVALGIATLALALSAADPPPPPVQQRAFLAQLAGDDSTGIEVHSTATRSVGTATPTPLGGTCDGERTLVKTLADAAAGFDRTPQDTGAVNLQLLSRPTVPLESPRILPAEGRAVRITVSLVGLGRGPNGGVTLTVAASPGGEAMVVAFPGQSCVTQAPAVDQGQMNQARVALLAACGQAPASGTRALAGRAVITGVPFWGPTHSDGKGSVNGIELHPVLSFEMAAGSDPCDPAAFKTPTPLPTPTPFVEEITVGASPNQVHGGETETVTINTQPTPAAGVTCTVQVFDANLSSMTSLNGTTGVSGTVEWTFVVPLTAPLGESRVQASCSGGAHTAQAKFFVVT